MHVGTLYGIPVMPRSLLANESHQRRGYQQRVKDQGTTDAARTIEGSRVVDHIRMADRRVLRLCRFTRAASSWLATALQYARYGCRCRHLQLAKPIATPGAEVDDLPGELEIGVKHILYILMIVIRSWPRACFADRRLLCVQPFKQNIKDRHGGHRLIMQCPSAGGASRRRLFKLRSSGSTGYTMSVAITRNAREQRHPVLLWEKDRGWCIGCQRTWP